MYRRWPWPSEDCIIGTHCCYDSESGYVFVRPQHGEHYRIELFEGDNFSGQRVELCEDCPFLRVKGLTKNCVNSIKVYGDGAWVSVRRCFSVWLNQFRAAEAQRGDFHQLLPLWHDEQVVSRALGQSANFQEENTPSEKKKQNILLFFNSITFTWPFF